MPCSYKSEKGEECQFCLPEDKLIPRRSVGEKWCTYHLPRSGTIGDASDKSSWSEAEIDEFNIEIRALIDGDFFSGEIDFDGVVFPSPANFQHLIVNKPITFRGAIFLGTVDFVGSKFDKTVIFNNVEFPSITIFSQCEFKDHAIFINSKFYNQPSFINSEFHSAAQFNSATFIGANFTGSKFKESCTFKQASFTGAMFFENVKVKSLSFENAKLGEELFMSYCNIGSVTFECSASVKDELLEFNVARFENTTFDNAVFNNRVFANTTVFTNAIFKQAPKFHNCKLHQDTDFEGSKFEDTRGISARPYRTLKLAMENVRSRREEGIFFSLEQECMRKNKNISRSIRWLSYLYGAISCYGQSVIRPVLILIGIWVTFSVMYALLLSPRISFFLPFDQGIIKDSFVFSFEQIVNPFYVWKSKLISIIQNTSPIIFKSIAFIQSSISIILIALTLLSARWQFKRG